MDEDAAIIDSIIREEAELNGEPLDNHGEWKTVSYPRRHRKHNPTPAAEFETGDDVFQHVDRHADERRRRVLEAQKAALEAVTGVKEDSGEEENNDVGNDVIDGSGDDVAVVKIVKVKKVKKAKVSVAEAAARIVADDLAAFLIDISESHESQEDIQLMRFADYFGRAFANVGSAQFPWMKMLKEADVSKMVDMPLCHVPEAVYKTSFDWLNRRSLDALGSFVLWLWDGVLGDFASHQGTVKGSKRVAPQTPIKCQVALFVVLAMTLRRKPDALISLLLMLKDSQKYVGHDKLPVTVWVIAQASQGDLAVGLYMWVHLLLPLLCGKSVNPWSRDLILQLVERILSTPKARQILLNGAVRKGERLVPPAALDTLMRLTFPSSSARIKATERFEAVYPALKEVALSGSGSKAMKQVLQQILSVAIEALGEGEGVPELLEEASDVCIWCLAEVPECYKQWENIYLNNIDASVVLLRKLYDEGKLQSAKCANLELVKDTLSSLRKKSKNALVSKEYADHQASLKEADKYCKLLLARLSRGHGCLKGLLSVSIFLGIVAVVSNSLQFEDFQRLLSKLNLQL